MGRLGSSPPNRSNVKATAAIPLLGTPALRAPSAATRTPTLPGTSSVVIPPSGAKDRKALTHPLGRLSSSESTTTPPLGSRGPQSVRWTDRYPPGARFLPRARLLGDRQPRECHQPCLQAHEHYASQKQLGLQSVLYPG